MIEVFIGKPSHVRFLPKANSFKFPVFYLRVNIDNFDKSQNKMISLIFSILILGLSQAHSLNECPNLVDDIFSAQDNVELLVIKSLQKNLMMGKALSEVFAESFKEREEYKKILNSHAVNPIYSALIAILERNLNINKFLSYDK